MRNKKAAKKNNAPDESVSRFMSKLTRTVQRAINKMNLIKAKGEVVPKEIDDALWDCGTFLGCKRDSK